MSYSVTEIWIIILGLGIGTYLIRLSFLGLIGQRPLPGFVQRLLRYTPVAVIPGLVAPLVLWPAATAGETDPPRLLAAVTTLVLGIWFRSVLISICGGAAVLFATLYLLT